MFQYSSMIVREETLEGNTVKQVSSPSVTEEVVVAHLVFSSLIVIDSTLTRTKLYNYGLRSYKSSKMGDP